MSQSPTQLIQLSQKVKEYFSAKHILIVDPSSAFVSNITLSLTQLGIPLSLIHTTNRFDEALTLIQKFSPHLIITEYFIGKNFGIKLIEEVDKIHGENNRIAILVTSNASDSAVAEAAEGQVDAYILKPFSIQDFLVKIVETFDTKITPSDYLRHLFSGKSSLANGQFDQAMEKFEEAKKIGKKPSLAYFYTGLTFQTKGNLGNAIKEFVQGLSLTPLHYRCLIGQYDSLYLLKNYPEAYKLIHDIKSHYPVTPQRLINFIITSVYTNNFQDLASYYLFYKELSHRPEELTKILSVSMKTAGKYYLKEKNLKLAGEYFNYGILIANFDPDFMESVIKELLKSETLLASQSAGDFFKKYPTKLVGNEAHTVLGFLIDSYLLKPEESLDKGKKILNQFNGNPDFYIRMVTLAKELNKKTFAEDIINKALLAFPELRKNLFDILEK